MSRFALLILVCAAGPALAHPGHGPDSGFLAGLAHPVGGLDHLLAMLAVGLWASQRPQAAWASPFTFLAGMVCGAAAAFAGVSLAGVETAILASVVLLGVATAANLHWSLWTTLPAVVMAGFFHGHAHGLEAPGVGAASLYVLGVLMMTALLHAGGAMAGAGARRLGQGWAVRLGGVTIALGGVALAV